MTTRIVHALTVVVSLWIADVALGDTTSSMGDRSGEGSTPFTGLAQAPEANLFTGAATTSLSIQVPPGRKNMTPQLALSYSSAAGPSPFGFGWDLPFGRIERSTKFGVPRCLGEHVNEYVAMMPSGSFELHPVGGMTWAWQPKHEDGYLRAQMILQSGVLSHWEVYDAAGMKYVFGEVSSARLTAVQEGCSFTTAWALTRIEDPNGNTISITWDNSGNVLYPTDLDYGGNPAQGLAHFHHIDVLYEPLSYVVGATAYSRSIVNNRNGAQGELTKRAASIRVTTDRAPAGQPTLVRTYALVYDSDSANEGYRSHLNEVRITGPSGTGSTPIVPPQTFAYSNSAGHRPATSTTFPAAFDALRSSNDGRVWRSMMDMTGDGMVDLVDARAEGVWDVYVGLKTGGFALSAVSWQVPMGPGIPDSGVAAIRKTWRVGNESRTTADTLDLTGDGFPDYVVALSACGWKVYPGTPPDGSGGWRFGSPIDWHSPHPYLRIDIDAPRGTYDVETYTRQDTFDVNGDGRPDLVVAPGGQSTPPRYTWQVYLNRGDRFDSRFYANDPPTCIVANLNYLDAFVAPSQWISASRVNNVGFGEPSSGPSEHGWVSKQVADFNGDGLPDYLSVASCEFIGGCLDVYFGTGSGFATTALRSPAYGAYIREWNGYDTLMDLLDINGDGLPDRVALAQRQLPDTSPWSVVLNQGGRLPYDAATITWPGLQGRIRRQGGTPTTYTTFDMVDANGDGLLDRVRLQLGASPAGSIQYNQAAPLPGSPQLGVAGSVRPHLLTAVKNGLGGIFGLRYRPSTSYDNTGGDPYAVTDLPSVTWVVSDTRRTDGLCAVPVNIDPFGSANACIADGHEIVAHHVYQDGRFDPVEREFLGFRYVYTIKRNDERPGGAAPVRRDNSVLTTFAQTSAIRGRVLSEMAYAGNALVGAGSSQLVRQTDNYWQTWQQPDGHVKVYLGTKIEQQWDLAASGVAFGKVTQFTIDAYGNTTSTRSTNLLSLGDITTVTEYAASAGSLVRDRPSRVASATKSDLFATPVKFAEKWFYYDDQPLGQVLKGNATRVESLVDAATAARVNSYTAYDSYGNVTLTTNERGARLWTGYDANKLHATQLTNELGHVASTVTDYRWGKPLDVTDPNGAVARSRYDDAGRVLCTATDGDSVSDCTAATGSSTATVWYRYVFGDGTPANPDSRVEIHRREPNRSSGYIPTIEHFDALARHRYTEERRVVDCQTGTTTVVTGHTEYDAGGRPRRQHLPYAAPFGAASNGFTEIDYHLNGHATYVDPLDRPSRVTAPSGAITTTQYDRGTTSTFDELGNKQVSRIDTYGRTTYAAVFDGASTLYSWTDYTHDGAGRVLTMTLNGNTATTVTTTYDLLGRTIRRVDPNSGTPTGPGTWHDRYDAAGNLVFEDDPLGQGTTGNQHIEYCYDLLNRVAGKYYRSGGVPTPNICSQVADIEYTYDTFSSTTSGNKGRGRLTRVRDLSGQSDWTFDLRGRVTKEKRTVYSDPQDTRTTYATFGYVYDAANRISRTDYPGGEQVTSVYDESGQPLQLFNTGQSIIDRMCHDAFGRVIRIEHSNGVVDTHAYYGATGDAKAHRLQRLSAQRAGLSDKYLDLSYANYDARGLLTRLDDLAPRAAVLSNGLATITYDHLRRVRQAIGANVNETYAYDPLGNITTKGARTLTPSTGKPHQIASVTAPGGTFSVSHDANGNRTAKLEQGETYQYNQDNRLNRIDVGADTVRFRYDFAGQQSLRILEGPGGVVTRYYSPLAETSSDGFFLRHYVLGNVRVASRRTSEVGWELIAAIDSPVRVAYASLQHPGVTVLINDVAQVAAASGVGVLVAGILLAPWRRRASMGMRVRRSHAVGLSVLVAALASPWPIALLPTPAQAGGGGGSPLRHWHLDHLQSTQVITDAAGAIIEQVRYTPYGTVRERRDGMDVPMNPLPGFRREFTGYETELVSGLQYAGARFYDPDYASFLTHDPAAQFNSPYTYTNWNPLNVTDPTGAITGIELLFYAAITLSAASAIASAVQVGIQTGDVGAAFKSLAIGAGIAVATWGFGSVISTLTTGLGPGVQASIQLASVGNAAYGTAQGFADGNYATAALGALSLAASLAFALGQGANGAGSGTNQPQDHELYVGAKFTEADAQARKVGIGHSYVGLREPGGDIQTYGFYPREGARFEGLEALRDVVGEIRADVDAGYLQSALAGEKGHSVVQYSITKGQYLSALDVIHAYQAQPYNAAFCNCTHFAVDVANAVGVRVPLAGIISRPAVFEPALRQFGGRVP